MAGRPIDDVRALIDPLIPRDSKWTPEIWFVDYFGRPEVLVGLGIIDAVGPVALTVEMPDGRAEAVDVGLVSPTDLLKLEAPSIAWLPALPVSCVD